MTKSQDKFNYLENEKNFYGRLGRQEIASGVVNAPLI